MNKLEGTDEEGRSIMTREELQRMNEDNGYDTAMREHSNDPHKRMDLCGFPRRRGFRQFFMNHDFRSEYPGAFKTLNDGNWVYIFGKKGTGKTSFACHLGWEYMSKHATRKATFLSIKDWIASLMPSENKVKPVEIPQLKPFIILDDIDKFQMEKDWQGLQIFRLLDHLYREADRFHVVITSNRSIAQLKTLATSDRTSPAIDRIWEMSRPIHIHGDSKRTPPQ
jgi:DNA replication protein DnaC